MKAVIGAGLLAAALLAACGPSDQQKARWAGEKRIECLDKVCEGDVIPQNYSKNEFPFKLNGQWFIGPREYGGYGGSFFFLWPSKTPANRENASKEAPEFIPSAAGQNSNYYEVRIEIFLTSRQRWPTPKVEELGRAVLGKFGGMSCKPKDFAWSEQRSTQGWTWFDS